MHEAKGAHSPMSTTKKHSFCGDSLSIDATLYHQILGVLQYLLMTCLDISFAINHLSQFMHCLKLIHWVVIKRVILYASSTISLHVFMYSLIPIGWVILMATTLFQLMWSFLVLI